ncbi:MAG TPA: hypothetical protein VEF04_08000 [Blastocatellia bacterium]|nr:hypothetical protein [Blastocatellia bacterium]
MKRFSFAAGVSCSLLMVATAIAQTGSGAVNSQSKTSAQAGNAQVSAEAQQNSNANVKRQGKKAEAQSNSQSQNKVSANSGQQSLNLESGTQLQAILKSTLDSKRVEEGQQFLMKTTRDIKNNGRTVIKKGSELVGHVAKVEKNAEGKGQSSFALMIDGVQQGGQVMPLHAMFVGIVQQTTHAALDSDLGSSMPSMPAPRQPSGGGGLLGGAVNNTLGATTQTVGSVAGSVTGTATGANTNSTLSGTVNSAVAGNGRLIGGEVLNQPGRVLFNVSNGLTATVSGTASGATEFTRGGKDFKLEKGTEFVLAITNNSQASAGSGK